MPPTSVVPHCPACKVEGVKHLATKSMGAYLLVYCDQCGAIYGVVPDMSRFRLPAETKKKTEVPPKAPAVAAPVKPQPAASTPAKTATKAAPAPVALKVAREFQPAVMPPQHAALTDSDLIRLVVDYTGEKVILSPTQLEHMYRNATPPTDRSAPPCEQHQCRTVKMTIPPGVPRAGDVVWACPSFSHCRQWRPIGPQAQPVPPQRLAELGRADLAGKLPYSPAAIANRMRAAGMSQGTAYRHFAMEDGPPLCLTHKVEMVQLEIPTGYRNAGRKMWVCATPGCREWELAE